MANQKIRGILLKTEGDLLPKELGLSTKQQPGAEVDGEYGPLDLIDPLYDPRALAKLVEQSSILQQCIDAYTTNIPGYGWDIVYAIDIESANIDERLRKQASLEWEILNNFYSYIHLDDTFVNILKKVIHDRESTGYGVIEVINNGKGLPAAFEYAPSHTFRMTRADENPQEIKVKIRTPEGKMITVPYYKRFRRFCQDINGKRTWFKEFGDPRVMDKNTGLFEGEPGFPESFNKQTDEANSVILLNIHSPYTPYGLPRYIGNLINILGANSADSLNYLYFKRGRHVSMAILVNNGSLTESTLNELREHVSSMEGADKAFGYLVLEASGFEEEDGVNSSRSPVNIELKPLTDALTSEGLFQEYDKNCRDKIRSSFRLPPIYTGESKDYTRATADTARQIAEEQVFRPERKALADFFNIRINRALGLNLVKLEFKSPSISNQEAKSRAMKPYVDAGMASVNMIIDAMGDILDKKFDQMPDEWGNLPVFIVKDLIKEGRLEITTPGKDAKPTEPLPNENPQGGEEK